MRWIGGWVYLLLVAMGVNSAASPLTSLREKYLLKKGTRQAAEVLRIFSERHDAWLAAWQKDHTQTWEQALAQWEQDLGALTLARIPYKEERYAAFLAARSPRFGAELLDFLTQKGALRFKYLNGPLERVRQRAKDSGLPLIGGLFKSAKSLDLFQPTLGRRTWEILPYVRLPAGMARESSDCERNLMAVADVVFQGTHRRPPLHTWLRAFGRLGQVRFSPKTWDVMRPVAEAVQAQYYAPYRRYLEQVAQEAYGRPNEGAVEDYYSFKSPFRRVSEVINKNNLDRARVETTALKMQYWSAAGLTTAAIAYAIPKLIEREERKEKILEFESASPREEEKISENPEKNADFERDEKKVDELTEKLFSAREAAKTGKNDPQREKEVRVLEQQIQEIQRKMEGEYDTQDNEIHP